MAGRTCQWVIIEFVNKTLDEKCELPGTCLVECELPGTCLVEWPDGSSNWFCPRHYDCIAQIYRAVEESGMTYGIGVVKLNGW